MTTSEIVTSLIALLGVIVAFVAIVRTRKVQAEQMRLQAKQEELTDIQLKLLKTEVERREEVGLEAERADVRVSLEGFSGHYRLVIRNWGLGSAKNVDLKISSPSGRASPLVENDYDEKIPIPQFAPGAKCSLIAALTFGTGTTFDAQWSWENPDGAQDERESRLAL